MSIEDEPKAEDAAPVAETAYARGSAASARAVTHSHFDDGSELIVVGSEGSRSSSGAGGNDGDRTSRGTLHRARRKSWRSAGPCRARLPSRARPGTDSPQQPPPRTTSMQWPGTTLGLSFGSR